MLVLLSLFTALADDPRPVFGAGEHMTEAQEQQILTALADRDPDRAKHLARLKTRDPGRYYEVLERTARRLDREERDPEARVRHERMESIRHEIRALAIEHQGASDSQKKKLRKEMEVLANQIFDLRQEERRMRIEKIQKKLAKAEEEIEDHDARRDEIIADHLDEVIQRQ